MCECVRVCVWCVSVYEGVRVWDRVSICEGVYECEHMCVSALYAQMGTCVFMCAPEHMCVSLCMCRGAPTVS